MRRRICLGSAENDMFRLGGGRYVWARRRRTDMRRRLCLGSADGYEEEDVFGLGMQD